MTTRRNHSAVGFDESETENDSSIDQSSYMTRASRSPRKSVQRTPKKNPPPQVATRGGKARGRPRKTTRAETPVASPRRPADSSNLSDSDTPEEESNRVESSSRRRSSPVKTPTRPKSAPSRRTVPSSPQPGPSSRPDAPQAAKKNKRKSKAPKVLREIWALQMSTKTVIPKLPFSRLVREILTSTRPGMDFRMQSEALSAIQEALETYMVQYMEDAYRCTLHRGQVTLKPADMMLVRQLRGVKYA